MKCEADVVFLGIRSSVYPQNGKTYHNVDFRADGRNMTLGTRCPEAFSVFAEYQPVHIVLDVFSYRSRQTNSSRLVANIVDVQAIQKGGGR